MEKNHFSNEWMFVWKEDGIMHVVYKEDTIITLEVAMKSVASRLEITGDVSWPMYIDSTAVKYFHGDARDYLSKGDSMKNIKAGAFLIKGRVQKILANYFIRFHKPPVPAKMFTKREEAIEWLQQFKN
jgi:hypothetical protein